MTTRTTHAKHVRKGARCLGTGVLLAIAGCAMADSASDAFNGARNAEKAGSDASAAASSSSSSSGGANAPPTGQVFGPTATGLILVHAAKFPSFRLCFEKLPDLAPQPDGVVMPDANVVGVEVGSVVRINPVAPPGKIYVIREQPLRGKTGTCGQLLDSNGLQENLDYQVAAPIETPLGKDEVHLLALSGCGGRAFLPPKTVEGDCGLDWDPDVGNLKGTVLVLRPTERPTAELPVQLVNLSPSIEAARGNDTLEVTFGALSKPGALPQPVAVGTNVLQEAVPQVLTLGEAGKGAVGDEVYAQYGFRIAFRNAKTDWTMLAEQTLASVQEFSSPQDVPSSYYGGRGNYALLLLGDPAAPRTLDGGPLGAPDVTFSRRGVHLLAIPVVDPASLDAGAPDGQAPSVRDGG